MDEDTMNPSEIKTLIRLVKENRAIYDRAHPQHNDQNYIKDIWISISEELHYPVKKIRTKWKSLRDSYRLKLYKIKQDIDYGPPWSLYDQMSFLEVHMRERKKSRWRDSKNSLKREQENNNLDNVDTTTASSYRNSIDSIEMVTVEDFDPTVLDSVDYSERSPSVDRIKAEVSTPNKTMLPSLELEEDRCFFESLLPYMKRLSPRDKMLCRMRIQEVVYSIAFPETLSENAVEGDS